MNNYVNKLYNCSDILKENTNDIGCVYSSIESNMSIYIHSKESDDLYLKIFNSHRLETATKCCRVKLFKSKYKEKPSDDYLPDYILNESEKENLINILNGQNSSLFGYLENCTLWEKIIKDFLLYNHNNSKIKKLLSKAYKNIPDYTKL